MTTIGYKHTDEVKKHMSEAHMGHKPSKLSSYFQELVAEIKI